MRIKCCFIHSCLLSYTQHTQRRTYIHKHMYNNRCTHETHVHSNVHTHFKGLLFIASIFPEVLIVGTPWGWEALLEKSTAGISSVSLLQWQTSDCMIVTCAFTHYHVYASIFFGCMCMHVFWCLCLRAGVFFQMWSFLNFIRSLHIFPT